MTVTFDGWASRDKVALMLEAPVRRRANSNDPAMEAEATDEIDVILRELDRIDRVHDAHRALQRNQDEHNAKVVEEYVKVEPAITGDMCAAKTYGRGNRPHRAKVRINGKPYCGTHEKRALENTRWSAISAHAAEYVEDPALRYVINQDRALAKERRGR